MISVIVPVLNGGPDLFGQLSALAAQVTCEPWEVIISDNGSTDGTVEMAQDWCSTHSKFHFVDASAVAGAAAARNAGVAQASGEYLAFCDADDVVLPGWLDACVEALHLADVGAGYFDFGLLNAFDQSQSSSEGFRPLGFLPAGLGANLAVRRGPFGAVGGFDEQFTPVGDDTDLCWRLQLAGYGFIKIHDALVAKRSRTTFREVFHQSSVFGQAGPLLYRRYRVDGLRRNFRKTMKAWAWLILEMPMIFQPKRRFEWARGSGIRIGRIKGSWRHRVFFP